MARDLSTLPNGTWLHFSRLPVDTTEESFAKFLYDCGLDVKAECISVRQYATRNAASATVALTREAVAALVNMAIDGETLQGGKVVALAPSARRIPIPNSHCKQ